jgi:hypothetical protein
MSPEVRRGSQLSAPHLHVSLLHVSLLLRLLPFLVVFGSLAVRGLAPPGYLPASLPGLRANSRAR